MKNFSKTKFYSGTLIDYTNRWEVKKQYLIAAVDFDEELIELQPFPDPNRGIGDWPERFWVRQENCEVGKPEPKLIISKSQTP